MRPTNPSHFLFNRVFGLGITFLLVFSFVFVINPAQATTPTICVNTNSSGGQTGAVAFTTSISTKTIGVPTNVCHNSGEVLIFSLYYPVPQGGFAFNSMTITDNSSNIYTIAASSTYNTCRSLNLFGACNSNFNMLMVTYTTTLNANVAHELVISISCCGGVNFPYTTTGLASWQFWTNLNSTVGAVCTGTEWYSTGTTYISFGTGAFCNIPTPATGIDYSFIVSAYGDASALFAYVGGQTYHFSTTTGLQINTDYCSLASSNLNVCNSQTGYSVNLGGTASPSIGYTCNSSCKGASVAVQVVSFGGSTGTTTNTNVQNVQCVPACVSGGSPNRTSTTTVTTITGTATTKTTAVATYLPTNEMIFYPAKNGVNDIGNVYNYSALIAGAHFTVATGYVQGGIYLAQTPTQAPGAGNQYALAWAYSFPITNNTIDKPLETNPNISICALCYYAVAFMANTTASRTTGSTGSGVSLYPTTAQVSMNQYPAPTGKLPTVFFANSVQTPALWFIAQLQFTLATLTVTSTITVGGTATTTVTSTVVTYATDFQATTSIWSNVLFIFFILFMIPLMFVAIGALTGNGSVILIMFVSGLTLSSMIAISAQLIPATWLILIAMVDLLCLLTAWRGR